MSAKPKKLATPGRRATDEWIGKTPDSPIPERVKERILERQEWRCAKTGADLRTVKKINFDHIIAIINGGPNRESNIAAIAEKEHKPKTRSDRAIRSKTASTVKAHYGLKNPSRNPMPANKDSDVKAKVGGGTEPRDKPPPKRPSLPPRQLYREKRPGEKE